MTREQIANFHFSAMVELTKDSARLDAELKKLGYDVTSSIIPDDDGTGYNGQFKRALLKVYKETVENNNELLRQFNEISVELKTKRKNKKHFIAIVTIDDDKDFEKATKCKSTATTPEKVKALNRELDWNELNGVSVKVIRSTTEEEIKKLKE